MTNPMLSQRTEILPNDDRSTEFEWPSGFGGSIADCSDQNPAPLAEHHIRVEKFVDGDSFVVRAELPDIDPACGVTITFADHTMLLNAERPRPDGVGRGDLYYGDLSRVIGLPAGTIGRYTATYSGGVLVIRLPIERCASEAADSQELPVGAAA